MAISLSELLTRGKGSLQVTMPIGIDEFVLNGCIYPLQSKSDVSMTLTVLSKSRILVELSGSMILLVPCDRCLKDVMVPIELSASQKLDFESEQEQKNDPNELSYIDGYDLDVDLMVREEILVNFPSKVLCSEDCKGICRLCGADLNKCECGCDRTELDPRMAVILDLFKKKDI